MYLKKLKNPRIFASYKNKTIWPQLDGKINQPNWGRLIKIFSHAIQNFINVFLFNFNAFM